MATGSSLTIRSKSAPQTTEGKSWLNIQRKADGNVVRPHELEEQLKWPSRRQQLDKSEVLNRIQGSFFGLAIGDAVGAFVEFRSKEFMLNNQVKTMQAGGTWGLEKGQFTDDTSMALCLAISLIVKEDFVPYDQLVRYKWWFREGYMSSTGKCFDIGKATRESLQKFEERQKSFAEKNNIPSDKIDYLSDYELLNKFDVDCSKDGVAGNGSLMRLAPVPLFFYQYPEYAVQYCQISGRITHGDQLAYDACRYYGALIVAAVRGASKEELLSNDFYTKYEKWFGGKPLHPTIMEIAQGSYKKSGDKVNEIRGTGFVVQTLEAALWAFYSDGNSFREGVLKAVNLGDDTDTTAAIYGQLAGAYYGFQQLDEVWRGRIYAKKFLSCISEWILFEGQQWKPKQSQKLIVLSPYTINKTFQNICQTTPLSMNYDSKTNINVSIKSNTTVNNNNNSRSSESKTSFHRSNSTNTQTSHTLLRPTISAGIAEAPFNPPPMSTERLDSIMNDLKALEHVDVWIQSLGKEFEPYARIFREKNVDKYWLLTHVNENTLQNYGITNRDHQQILLTHINNFKRIELNLDQIFPPTK